MIASILKNFNLFVENGDSKGYAGKVEELTLPKLSLKTEEYRAGGMNTPIEIDMGMEKLECDFSLSEYAPEVLQLFGLVSDDPVVLTMKGAMENDDGSVVPIVVNVRGRFREIDNGSWKAGEKATMKCTVTCRYYKLTIDGKEIHEVDVVNMVRKINGEDQLAKLRDAVSA